LERLRDVPEVPQLRLSVDAKQVSLGEPLLTAGDAAALLSVRPSWVYEAVRDGRLPCVRVGRHVRFLRTGLEDWVRAQRAPGRA
jgi:excisionase family DNA binding protein